MLLHLFLTADKRSLYSSFHLAFVFVVCVTIIRQLYNIVNAFLLFLTQFVVYVTFSIDFSVMILYNVNMKRGELILNERLKKLRKTLDLTQQELADKLGVKRNTVAQWEIGRNEPSDAIIFSICREFDVNKEWLRTGEGEMFVIRSDEEEIAAFLGDVLAEEGETYKKQLILALANLSDEGWRGIKEFLDAIIAEKKERGEL